MNKDKIIVAITLGIICAILVFVLTVQLRTVKETDITSIENMREYELKEQIEIWKNKYEETQAKVNEDNRKINEYKTTIANNQEANELLTNELNQTNTLLGKTNVKGEGIIINLNSDSSNIIAEDLIKLVNELKLAGAEAISINNKRIINITDIVDVNSYILINGERTNAPYEIKVIGNSQYLMSGINAKGGFSDLVKNNGKSISIAQERTVEINKFDGDIKLKKMKID